MKQKFRRFGVMMPLKKINWLLLALIGTALCGCGPKEGSCEWWIKKLQGNRVDKAVREIGDNKCTAGLPALQQTYDDFYSYRTLVLQTVKKINLRKQSTNLIIKALGDIDSGAIAAYLVKDWKLLQAVPHLKKVIQDDAAEPFVKAANLKTLIALQGDKAEDFLIEILQVHPEKQGIELNRLAARALGDMKSVKALPYLINALYFSRGKQNVYGEASLALAKMAKLATPLLIKSIEHKNATLKAYQKKSYIYDFVLDLKLAVIARDLRMPELGPYLYKYLTSDYTKSAVIHEKLHTLRENAWISRMSAAAIGLAYLGDLSYVAKLKETFKNADMNKRIRVQALTSYVHLVGPASKASIGSVLRGVRNKNPKKDKPLRSIRWNFFEPFAKVADHHGVKILRKIMEEEHDAEVKRGMSLSEPLMSISEHCKDSVACWKKMLTIDIGNTRVDCGTKPETCPVSTLKPVPARVTARTAYKKRAVECKTDRVCWGKVFLDARSQKIFGRLSRPYQRNIRILKKGIKALSEKQQKNLMKWLDRLPVQLRLSKRGKQGLQSAIRQKAALILGFSAKKTKAIAVLRSFLSHRDVITREMVLFGLEKQKDKGAIKALKEQIAKEKDKTKYAYIGDRMQLLVFRLERM